MDGKTKLDEAKLKAEFAADPDLQSEFGDVKAFVAYRKVLAEGQSRGHSGEMKSSKSSSENVSKDDEEAWKQEFAASEVLQTEYATRDSRSVGRGRW